MKWKYLLALIFLILSACKHETIVQGYIQGQLIHFSSNVAGILKKLAVYRGNIVQKNQILFSLDPEPEQSDLAASKATLEEAKQNLENLLLGQRNTVVASILAQNEQAKANLIFAQQTLTRYKKLYAVHAIDKATLDRATSDYKSQAEKVLETKANLAEAQLGARQHLILAQQAVMGNAQANLQKASWQLRQKTASATNKGQIFDTYFKEGEFIPAGQPVLSLLTPDNIKLIFYIPEPLLSHLHLGDTVSLTCDGCKTQMAHVDYISPQAEYTPPVLYSRESRGKLVYRIEASIPVAVAPQFHPGQPVDVTIKE